MQTRNYLMPFLVILLIFQFCVSHAQIRKPQLNGMRPKYSACILTAPEKAFPNYKKIAVLDFKSTDGNESGIGDGAKIADYLTKMFIEEQRGMIEDQVYTKGGTSKLFDVMDRSNIKSTLRNNPQIGDDVDENEAVEIGKVLGVDAVIIGSCSYTSKDETSSSDKYRYRIRTVDAEARMSIIDVATGEFVGSSSARNSKQEKKSSEGSYPSRGEMTSDIKLAELAYSAIANTLANYLNPSYQTTSFLIKNITIKKYRARAKDAKEQLKLNNIDPAYQLYYAIYEEDNYNPKAAYNLGTVYEAGGEYEKAAAHYLIAHQLDDDDKMYDTALARIEQRLKDKETLDTLDIHIAPHEFEKGNTAEVLREKVRMKGFKRDRKPVYAEADENSDIVREVPGSMEFAVISVEGDWYLVDLIIGGKQGYVHSKDVIAGK